MIVVFVVDNTSPSMRKSANMSEQASHGLTRLDIAKMTIDAITKAMNHRIQSHNNFVTSYQEQQSGSASGSLEQIGLGRASLDHFLLISTGYQSKYLSDNQSNGSSSSSAIGNRILVDYGSLTELHTTFEGDTSHSPSHYQSYCAHLTQNHANFDKALKNLSLTKNSLITKDLTPAAKALDSFPPENGGGVHGLNAALSAGLQLMSRYRLHNRWTENFGLGRLPSTAIVTHGGLGVYGSSSSSSTGFTSSVHQTTQALQPACLILLTDGECLNQPPELGGGTLELQYGNMPLREFYKEPFRWDQRIICLCINSSSGDLHPSLKALCDVTGGYFSAIPGMSSIEANVKLLLRNLAPPFPSQMPFPNPLQAVGKADPLKKEVIGGMFINGGPICCFQPISSEIRTIFRAMLLYVPTSYDNDKYNSMNTTISTPMWSIPEAFFPSSKFDTLPPRNAQPHFIYADVNNLMGFNALDFIKALNRLDDLMRSIQQDKYPGQAKPHYIRFLQRDVYICEWLSSNGVDIKAPISSRGQEFFPIFVRGAGRSTTIDGTDNLLSVGILRIPRGCVTLATQSTTTDHSRLSTLTLFPPDAHILLPLLIRAAEIEYRSLQIALKRKEVAGKTGDLSMARVHGGSVATLIRKISDSTHSSSSTDGQGLVLDDNWHNEMKAYIYRIPPYCLVSVKRCLKPLLPSSAHHLLGTDKIEAITSQCFSRLCHQKIRAGEAVAKDAVDRVDHRHDEVSLTSLNCDEASKALGYGQYDRKTSLSSYLATLRTINPPWKHNHSIPAKSKTYLSALEQNLILTNEIPVTTCLGDLPMNALLAYYDSRRRWIFGGCGQTVSGLFVEGVKKDSDSNLYRHNRAADDESLLTLSSVGASDIGQIKISNMGDFRERLFWSPQTVAGYGCNAATRSAVATGPDGAPIWSVDDDALPFYCFDPITGEFIDTPQSRTRSKLAVNFGNPYKDHRGDAFCPKNYERMSPGLGRLDMKDDEVICQPDIDLTNEAFIDGEGEADSMKICVGPLPKRSRLVSENSNTDSNRRVRDQGDGKQHIQQDSNAHHAPLSLIANPTSSIVTKLNVPPLVAHDRSKPPPPPTTPHPTQLEQRPDQAQYSASSDMDSLLVFEGLVKANMQDPNNKPDIKLPPEWMLVWSKSKKRWYYFDRQTQASVWEWPPPAI